MGHLISPEQLHELIASGSPGLRILDVRWRLDRPNGRPEHLAGHLPGAVYVDLDTELAEHGRPAAEGRHPLPALETLQTAARRWGLNDGDTVVVYDDMKNTSSARAWWLLRHAGLRDVRVLDGSLRGWARAGYPLETGDVVPEPGTVTLQYGALGHVDIDDAASFPHRGTLLDVRIPERYRGEVEPMDPRPGHIPGALNAPTAENVDQDGRFLLPEALRERFLALGVDPQKPVASYCGSGINGCHSVLALELAGFEAVLYPGSFSEWSNNYDRPVATGNTSGQAP
ncbi:sulfurtransferase [Nesterenkonia ebinurensis]|uniref:sulfurtransferase n=1 Tax=Nesterenkonia ebinurensis TaxID=2608252 RepID=UPI00123E0771|nr:sulfurtransferase [Nesterenkonia ebinurensis]